MSAPVSLFSSEFTLLQMGHCLQQHLHFLMRMSFSLIQALETTTNPNTMDGMSRITKICTSSPTKGSLDSSIKMTAAWASKRESQMFIYFCLYGLTMIIRSAKLKKIKVEIASLKYVISQFFDSLNIDSKLEKYHKVVQPRKAPHISATIQTISVAAMEFFYKYRDR